MEDFAGNKLDPPYEEEIDSFFGGVLRTLEALWEFLVDLASRIADAVGRAVSFIVGMLTTLVPGIIEHFFKPVLELFQGWFDSIVKVIKSTAGIHSSLCFDPRKLGKVLPR